MAAQPLLDLHLKCFLNDSVSTF